jgi:hypothetical protein
LRSHQSRLHLRQIEFELHSRVPREECSTFGRGNVEQRQRAWKRS